MHDLTVSVLRTRHHSRSWQSMQNLWKTRSMRVVDETDRRLWQLTQFSLPAWSTKLWWQEMQLKAVWSS